MSEARLTRSITDSMIAGVCGGLAAYLGIDSVLIRLAFVVLFLASGIGVPIYLVLWIIMPLQETADQPNAQIVQKNLEEMGQTVTSSVSRIGRPTTIGVFMILLGVYFLFGQLGWLDWISGGILWPLLIIGFGVYLLARRSQ